jgi:hypothetical protein
MRGLCAGRDSAEYNSIAGRIRVRLCPLALASRARVVLSFEGVEVFEEVSQGVEAFAGAEEEHGREIWTGFV